MTRLRQTIAKRLKEAQENAAMLTTFNEVDMSGIISMRKENQDDFQSRYGIKLGFMSFFVKACVVSLKKFPPVNAEIEGDEIIYKNYYNIGFAVKMHGNTEMIQHLEPWCDNLYIDVDFEEYIKRELVRVSAYVENRVQHNIFYRKRIAN